MLYLLVEPDKLLAGLPLFENIGLPGSEDWREELESGDSFMLASGRSWLSVPEFCTLLPSRLNWLRSVNPPEQRLDNKGNETDGERALRFHLEQGGQYLDVLTTNWMQLALPEHIRTRCLMISLEFECASAKSKMWIPENHPVMPLLLRFLEAVQFIYGRVASDDVDALNQYTVEEVNWGTRAWEGLWDTPTGCAFLNHELVRAVEERSNLLGPDGGLGYVRHLPGGGVWYTSPDDWTSNYFSNARSERSHQHWQAIYLLSDVLKTIPDSAIFPDLTP